MKYLFALGYAVAAADAALPTHLDGEVLYQKHQHIISNPHNQQLFAEREAVPRKSAAVATNPDLNLRTAGVVVGPTPVDGKDTYLLLEGYSMPDCSGSLTMRQAFKLNDCIRGVDSDGHEVAYKYKAWTSPLKISQIAYDNGNCDREGIVFRSNLLKGLPFDSTYTPGSCAIGPGMIGNFVTDPFQDNAWNGVAETLSGSGFACRNDDIYELNFVVQDVCNEEDDGSSFKYTVGDCMTSGSFIKTVYSDNACSVHNDDVPVSEEHETCRFNYWDFAALTANEEEMVMYEYASKRCIEAAPSR